MSLPRIGAWLAVSAAFAATHLFAIEASLYWYYSWFDSMMHLWGGLLLGSGIHMFARFSLWRHTPQLAEVLLVITVVVITWEVFEYIAGLYSPATYIADTVKDVVLGYGGGLLAHVIINSRYNRTI